LRTSAAAPRAVEAAEVSNDPLGDNVATKKVKPTTLPLLVSYGNSSSNSEASEEEAGDTPAVLRATGPLPIPAAIRELYEEEPSTENTEEHQSTKETESDVRASTMDSDSDSSLNYFELTNSTSEDEEEKEQEQEEEEKEQEEEEEEEEKEAKSGSQLGNFSGTPGKDLIPAVTKKWSDDKAQWLFGPSQLSSYSCWKCSNIGHLAQDCTVVGSHSVSASSGSKPGTTRPKIPREVQALLATCRDIRLKKGHRCADCGIHTNLAACLDCG